MIVRKGFCRESELRGIFGPRRRSLISNNLSGPNVSSPISSNGQDCNAQTFEHFLSPPQAVFLLPPVCISRKTLVGTLEHSSLSIPRVESQIARSMEEESG